MSAEVFSPQPTPHQDDVRPNLHAVPLADLSSPEQLTAQRASALARTRAVVDELGAFLPEPEFVAATHQNTAARNCATENSDTGNSPIEPQASHELARLAHDYAQQILNEAETTHSPDTFITTSDSDAEHKLHVSWDFSRQLHLEAIATASRYAQIFRSLIHCAHANGLTLKPGDITPEFFTAGKGWKTYRQAEEGLKTSAGLKPSAARKLLSNTIMVHAYAPWMLDQLTSGELSLQRFELILTKLRSISTPKSPGKKATDEECTEFEEASNTAGIAREHLAHALLDRSAEDTRPKPAVPSPETPGAPDKGTGDDGAGTPETSDSDPESTPENPDSPTAPPLSEVELDKRFAEAAKGLLDIYQLDSPTQRALQAATRRYVKVEDRPDAMAMVNMYLPAVQARQLEAWLERAVRSILHAGDSEGRSRNEIRADLVWMWIRSGIAHSTSKDAHRAQLTDAEQKILDDAPLPPELLANPNSTTEPTSQPNSQPDSQRPEASAPEQPGKSKQSATPEQPNAPSHPGNSFGPTSDNQLTHPEPDGTNQPVKLPGVNVHVVLLLTLGEHLELGGVVTDDLLPVLDELDPHYGELARRNLTEHRKLLAGSSSGPPDWLNTVDKQYVCESLNTSLTPQQAWELTNEASMLTSVLAEPATGYHLGYSHTSYKPSQLLRVLVELRDVTCRVPGCCVRAADCELDHVMEFVKDNGVTSYINLVFLCPNHHQHKTAGWYMKKLRKDLGDGVVEFTNTRDGTTHISRPRRPVHPVAYRHLLKHEEEHTQDDDPPF